MAIIASNDDAKKEQEVQTEKKNEADLDRKPANKKSSPKQDLTEENFAVSR